MLVGYKTYITGAVIILVAALQYFNVIKWDQNTYQTVITALGALAAIFLRVGVNGN